MTAMLGWSISSLVTILNSVKQHTINTLLQSRLSGTYMGYADKVNIHFNEFAKKYGLEPAGWGGLNPTDEIDKPSLRYIMNYFEFISIGIRHGDLSARMMRASLGSIVKNTVIFSDSFIAESKAKQPLAFCNLIWLFEKWKMPTWRERFEERFF